MLSGHLQGRILSMISQLKSPRRILEVGTFTGYATLCLAEGLPADGQLVTIEANPELAWFIEKYKQKAGLSRQIRNITGRAEVVIPALEETFDLAFIDAGKRDYPVHFDLVMERMKPGGVLLVDNVLWSGKVLEEPENYDADTRLLDAFNEKIQADERIENILLPIRDGITLMRKK
jgi:predicted O-methyltransferase YrrM